MKRCCHCKEMKSLDCFSKDKHTKDGLKKTCKDCSSFAYKVYHQSHPEKALERTRKWRLLPENKKKNCEVAKRYYWKNPIISRIKSNLKKKTELGKARVRRYNNNRRDRFLKQENTLDVDDVSLLLRVQDYMCACCKKEFSDNLPYTVDHIIPLSKGGGLTLKNTQLLCRSCNSKKNNKSILYRNLLPFETVGGL